MSSAVMEASDSPPAVQSGRWVKGQSGNPRGRPKKELTALQRDLEGAVREHLSPDKVRRILNKLVEKAEGGDVKAAKLILDKLVPNAVDAEESGDTGRTVVFRIENATFAAQQQARQSDKSAAIDVEVQTVETQVDNGKAIS